MIYDLRRCERSTASAQRLRDRRVTHGVTPNVKLIDRGLVRRSLGRDIALPIERGINNAAFRHKHGIVAGVEGEIEARVSNTITTVKIVPFERAVERTRIGIDEELVRIEPMTRLRIIRTINAITVEKTWSNFRNITVPDIVLPVEHCDTMRLARAPFIKQAKLDFFGMRGEKCEIDTISVETCAEWRWLPCLWLHHGRVPSGNNTRTPSGGRLRTSETA